MPTRRLLIDSLVAAVIAAALGVVGWLAAEPLLRAACELSGLDRVSMTSPHESLWYRLSLAFAFALPALAAWCAALIERVAGKDVPRSPDLFGHWLVPASAVFLAITTRLRDVEAIAAEMPALGGLEPMLAIDTLDFGPRALTWGAVVSLVMWTLAGAVASRRARRRA